MAPIASEFAGELIGRIPSLISERATNPKSAGTYNQHAWGGAINIATVDLLAMVVSDAGLASTEPEWWNASPKGCLLIALQPRGGWQVMQRSVQWGNDSWARSFGVHCKMPVLYCYFACSMRNRLEVWNSDNFISPMEGNGEGNLVSSEPVVETAEKSDEIRTVRENVRDLEVQDTQAVDEKELEMGDEEIPQPPHAGWKRFSQNSGFFTVRRPTKLTDGSRGGQAFICSLLRPDTGHAYSIEEQARMQLLSIILVSASLAKSDSLVAVKEVMRKDFDIGPTLGGVFQNLVIVMFFVEFLVIGFVASVFYTLWKSNIYGTGAPYVLQLCSLSTWAFGAAGLLMLGGNPRVELDEDKKISTHIQERLGAFHIVGNEHIQLDFGSLHGSIFTQDRGSTFIHRDLAKAICAWDLHFIRNYYWQVALIWFSLHILTSVTLQVAGSKVATLQSQVMGIVFLVATSVIRGQGISGPEEWMIPKSRMREKTGYAVALQGKMQSRAK